MIRCLPAGVRLYESHEICKNFVTFGSVKSTYQIDEDVVVDYTLQNEFKSSTRDWIGIFPRNWLNLQQYLTFEYTLSPSPIAKNPLNRTITFPRIFHREAPLNLEYQFVYISKEIQLMAMSTSFRFTPPHSNELAQLCSCASKTFPTIEVLSSTKVNNNELTIKEEKSSLSEIPSQITLSRASPQNCRYCHRKICGSNIDALRGDFLAAFSDAPLNRVHRLERDLSFAENALKNVKGARENLAKRLRAYEAFVAEMLGSLAVRGIVKITDEKGKEIVLRRVSDNDRFTEGDTKKIYALEDEIVALKSLLKQQQQTIVELEEQRKFYNPQRERIKFVDCEVQTNIDSSCESGALDLTVKREIKPSLDDRKEKIPPSTIIKDEAEEKFDLDSKAQTNETDAMELLKNRSKNIHQTKNITIAERILKVPKPSGILVQGKNVQFAIVRL